MSRTTHAVAVLLTIAATLLLGCSGKSEQQLIESARHAIDKKDHSTAIIELKNALQKNNQSSEARYLLGSSLLDGGDPAGAVVELRKAQEYRASDDRVVPPLARAMLMLGEHTDVIAQFGNLALKDAKAIADLKTTLATCYVQQGDFPRARETLEIALQAQPLFAPAMLLQARLQALDGKIGSAIGLLDQVLAQEPGNEFAGVAKGDLLWLGKKDVPAALAAYRNVLALNAKSVRAQSATVALLFQTGQTAEARRQFEQLQKLAPNHPETLFYEAEFAFVDKDYKRTRELTDLVLKYADNNIRAMELAGAAEFRMGQYPQALAFLDQALKLSPGLVTSRQIAAQTYLRTGQPNKALEVLKPLLELAPPNGAALALAGEAYLQTGDAQKSDAAFQRASRVAAGDPGVRTSAALAQLARGQTGLAIAELESIAGDDKGTRADLAIISTRMQQRDFAGALKAIEGLQKKQPEQPLAYQLRGEVQVAQRNLAAATASFETALAKDPKSFGAVSSLAAMEAAAGKPELARKRFDALLKIDPNNPEALLARAELAESFGAPTDEVLRLAKEAVVANPTVPKLHLALIAREMAAGDAAAALTAAQAAAAALPNDLDVLDALGRAQIASGNGQQAVSSFRKLAALQPTNASHQARLADAHLTLKDRDAASKALKRALELDPDLAVAQRGLVTMALADGRLVDAMAIAREAQRRKPKDGTGFALEGDVEIQRKDWDAAAKAYQAALERAPAADNAIKLHAVLLAAGKRADAARVATVWLKSSPRDPAFRYYLGDLAMGEKDLAGAEGYYRKVLVIQPRNALALNNVAWLLVKQGKPGAVAMAEKANALMPGRAPLLDTLATALAAENQLPKAIETQKLAVSASSKDPMLRLGLARYLVKAGKLGEARDQLEPLAKLGDSFPLQAEVTELLKLL